MNIYYLYDCPFISPPQKCQLANGCEHVVKQAYIQLLLPSDFVLALTNRYLYSLLVCSERKSKHRAKKHFFYLAQDHVKLHTAGPQ